MRVMVLVVPVAIGVVVVRVFARTAATPRDVAWLASSPGWPSREVAAVYSRYLERHRRHRLAGGLFGAAFAIVVGIRMYGSVSIGISEGTPLADIAFCALAGTLLGSLSAESFRLSEPESRTIVASLATRPSVADPHLQMVARLLTLVTVAMSIGAALAGHELAPLSIAVVGLGAMAVAELTQRSIATRRRPVLSDAAVAVDLDIRQFAGRASSLLQLAAAVLTAAWVASKLPPVDNDVVGLARVLAGLGGLIVVVVLLHRAAPRPPRSWRAGQA